MINSKNNAVEDAEARCVRKPTRQNWKTGLTVTLFCSVFSAFALHCVFNPDSAWFLTPDRAFDSKSKVIGASKLFANLNTSVLQTNDARTHTGISDNDLKRIEGAPQLGQEELKAILDVIDQDILYKGSLDYEDSARMLIASVVKFSREPKKSPQYLLWARSWQISNDVGATYVVRLRESKEGMQVEDYSRQRADLDFGMHSWFTIVFLVAVGSLPVLVLSTFVSYLRNAKSKHC